MQSGINRDGFTPSDINLDDRDAENEGFIREDQRTIHSQSYTARLKLESELDELREEVGALRERVASLPHRARKIAKAEASWIDASAHAQLGRYPWLKLSLAFGGSAFAGLALKRLPLGLLAAALVRSTLSTRR